MAVIRVFSVYSKYLLSLSLLIASLKALELNDFDEASLESLLREQQQQQNQQLSNNEIYYEPQIIDKEAANNLLLDQELQNLYFGDNKINNENIDEILRQNDIKDLNDDNSFFELSSAIDQTTGLAIDPNENLVLFHRSGRIWDEFTFTEENKFNKTLGAIRNSTIVVIDPKIGRIISEHGANDYYMPHGLQIDSNGSYWLTDVGRHQVIKLDKNFKKVMELGEKFVPGNDEKHFCKPTDVAIAKNGDFFVADGYCNSRIMKFNKHGKFLISFGMPNSQNPPKIGEFFVPHSLALIEDLNLLCVADRENKRIQCFAAGLTEGAHYHPRAYIPTGTFFTKAENIGRVYAIREKNHFLVGVTSHDESGQVESQVFVMDMNTGRANTFAKGLQNAHSLAISNEGDIYIAQLNPNQIVKFSISELFNLNST